MKFHDRKRELATLREIEQAAQQAAQLTVVVGRRRVGKTTLLRNAFGIAPVLYFFVARKNEVLLCKDFTAEVEEKLGETLGEFRSFAQLFRALMKLSAKRSFALIIDEFQEFKSINNAVFSDLQNIWDELKNQSRLNLVVCSSVYSMMKQIFENAKEPLYGRATARLHIKPFGIETLKEILRDYYPTYQPDDLLAFYLATGGVAKYVEQLVALQAFTKEKILQTMFSPAALFLEEGRVALIDEFGRDYGTYFSVLQLIAQGKTSRSDMESTLGIAVGGHLDRLEVDYNIIERKRPFGASENSRNVKYRIADNFLNFWFRFVHKYRSAIELGNIDYVHQIALRDYETYSELLLERYFRQKMAESMEFSAVESYWNRKGEDEIDVVAVNDVERRMLIGEVKRNADRISLGVLQKKAEQLVAHYADYQIEYKAFSLDDM